MMKNLLTYLKPFIVGIVLTLLLLFGQALCDLVLPSYMSDIVDIGIMQSGVDHAAPTMISPGSLRLMKSFMMDITLVDHSYIVPSQSASEPCVLRKGISRQDRNTLDDIFCKASWALAGFMREWQSFQTVSDDKGTALEPDIKLTMGLQSEWEKMPKDALQLYLKQAEAADPLIRGQNGLAFARAFYKELGVDIDKMQSDYILRTGLFMLLVAMASGLFTVLVSLISARVAAGAARDLRLALVDKINAFSHAEFDQFSVASLITRSTNDITQIQMILTFGLRMISYTPIMAAGGIFMAVRKSPSQAWILALVCIVMLCLILAVLATAFPKFELMQTLVDKLNLVSREHLSGQLVIRSFGTEEHEKARFARVNRDLSRTTLFVSRIMVTLYPVMVLLMNGFVMLIVWTGAHQIESAAMQVGDIMAFIQYVMMVIMSFATISMFFVFIPRALVSAARIAEVLRSESSVIDPSEPFTFDSEKRGVVEFKNVHFRYRDAEEDALSDITFTAKPGQIIAFIGSTGSGKSTVCNLLLRFYDVTGGTIQVGGVDVRKVGLEDLRKRIGYVPQQGALLSGSIASNIKCGVPGASDREMEAAAAAAQALDFVNQKENRFEQAVAQSGSNLSGGQKQRVSIARALLKKPEIFIFDDCFSALDYQTDRALRHALKEYTRDSTVLLVAQRVSTIMAADLIIVLDHGKIVGIGSHRELLKSCPQYYEIASFQLSKEKFTV
jgi:ATP-binding cassette subfamily B protein